MLLIFALDTPAIQSSTLAGFRILFKNLAIINNQIIKSLLKVIYFTWDELHAPSHDDFSIVYKLTSSKVKYIGVA